MASNEVRVHGDRMYVTVTSPTPVASTTPAAGDPCLYGVRPGVADVTTDAASKTTVHFGGVYLLSVKGVNAGGNVAVAEGDAIYYTDGDTPKLSKKATGTLFGYAQGTTEFGAATVGSGSTKTIPVKIAAT